MLACKNVIMQTALHDSISTVFKRFFFGGETFFQNSFTAKEGGGWVSLKEGLPGQIASYALQPDETLTITNGCFVAADANVKISTTYGGIKSWFTGVGFVKLEATAKDEKVGRVFFSKPCSTSKVIKITKEEGPIIIDNAHTLAYTDKLNVTTNLLDRTISLFFSGEGNVSEFSGDGIVFIGSGVINTPPIHIVDHH